MQLSELKPQFVLVMGGAGSGKNHFVENNSIYSTYKLVDVDAFKAEIGISAAILQIKPRLREAFKNQENVIHTTTASNLKAQQDKIRMAHEEGYVVTLVFIDTPVEQAIENVRNRVRKGGHDIPLDSIISTNKKSRENFVLLSPLVDKSTVI